MGWGGEARVVPLKDEVWVIVDWLGGGKDGVDKDWEGRLAEVVADEEEDKDDDEKYDEEEEDEPAEEGAAFGALPNAKAC